MLHVGLTGNIASGKSHAAQVFTELGAHILDADVIARELVEPGTETYREVVRMFGPEVVRDGGAIDRRLLGQIIFNDPSKRAMLNSVVHPGVRTEIVKRIAALERKGEGGIIVIDAALMVETGSYRAYDRLVVVRCNAAQQLLRLMKRDNLSETEARARMAAQMPADEKARVADYVIDTSGSFEETRAQVESVYRALVVEEARLRRHPDS